MFLVHKNSMKVSFPVICAPFPFRTAPSRYAPFEKSTELLVIETSYKTHRYNIKKKWKKYGNSFLIVMSETVEQLSLETFDPVYAKEVITWCWMT